MDTGIGEPAAAPPPPPPPNTGNQCLLPAIYTYIMKMLALVHCWGRKRISREDLFPINYVNTGVLQQFQPLALLVL